MRTKTITISYDSRVRAFWMLASVAALSLGLYFYGLYATVHHTVTRQALQSRISDLSTRVSELEFNDIALKNDVNLAMAESRGFTEVKDPLYISRSASRSLSFNSSAR